jgi:hypothetical protein
VAHSGGLAGGVLADAALPAVHRRGDLGHVPAQLRIGEAGQPRRPGVRGAERHVPGRGADPGIEDGGVRPCAGERPAGDRGPDHVGTVQPGELGRVDGAPQPAGVLQDLFRVRRLGAGADSPGVPAVGLGAALVHPDRVQRREMVGIRERVLPGFGCGQLAIVTSDYRCQDRDRVMLIQDRSRLGAFPVGLEPASPGERWPALLESVLGATPREFESPILRRSDLRERRSRRSSRWRRRACLSQPSQSLHCCHGGAGEQRPPSCLLADPGGHERSNAAGDRRVWMICSTRAVRAVCR